MTSSCRAFYRTFLSEHGELLLDHCIRFRPPQTMLKVGEGGGGCVE